MRSMVSESENESPESARMKCLAFCMAAHSRLGRQTLPYVLDKSLMQMIAQPVIKGTVAREAFVEHLRIPSLRHRPGAEIIGEHAPRRGCNARMHGQQAGCKVCISVIDSTKPGQSLIFHKTFGAGGFFFCLKINYD